MSKCLIKKFEILDIEIHESKILRPVNSITDQVKIIVETTETKSVFKKTKVTRQIPEKITVKFFSVDLTDPITNEIHTIKWTSEDKLKDKDTYNIPDKLKQYYTVVTIKGQPFFKLLPYIVVTTVNQVITKSYQNLKQANVAYESLKATLNSKVDAGTKFMFIEL